MTLKCPLKYKRFFFPIRCNTIIFSIRDLKKKDEEKLLLEKATNDLESFIIDVQVSYPDSKIKKNCYPL